ncbi:interleukin-21 receptor [Cololabis saira]|uniref:interleukin-21 receptor n=1 Tax=Cololabis saira TaxID=129043 RepID=UPI002AD2B708|nr:interleukin-21 receptor [Cololabis saira]
MDPFHPVQMRVLLFVFLLQTTKIVWLQGAPVTGVDHHLHCVNDYLFTVNCSLKISAPQNASQSNNSYWLTFEDIFEKTEFECRLKKATWEYSCSNKTSSAMPHDDDYPDIFTDTDAYTISLCHNKDDGSKTCELLDDEYTPVTNIKPNAPCCLTVSHNSSQHHFAWQSTYEEYSDITDLTKNLQYQLKFYKTEDKQGGITHDVSTDSTSYSLDDDKCLPDAKYAARVRSSPNMAHYKGQWSDWSSEVLWRTDPHAKGFPTNLLTFELRVLVVALCVLVTLLLLCYVPLKKWRHSTFIPTPAPYFHTLYSHCQGDFKSWVVTHDNAADMMKTEETLHIDALVDCTDVQDTCTCVSQQQLLDGSTYENVPSPSDLDLKGFPHSYTTMGLLSAQNAEETAEDSGCWLCSNASLENERSWYCNEYCTLKCFQQSGCVQYSS